MKGESVSWARRVLPDARLRARVQRLRDELARGTLIIDTPVLALALLRHEPSLCREWARGGSDTSLARDG